MDRRLWLVPAALLVLLVGLLIRGPGAPMNQPPGLTPKTAAAQAQDAAVRPPAGVDRRSPTVEGAAPAIAREELGLGTRERFDSVELFGAVTDTGGQPVEGARVSLFSGNDELESARTDADGAYSLDSIGRGTFELAVRSDEHFWVYEPLVVDGSVARIERNFALEPRPLIAVHLVRSSGRPTFPILSGEVDPRLTLKEWRLAIPVASRTRFESACFDVRSSFNERYRMGNFWLKSQRPESEDQGPSHHGSIRLAERPPGWIGFVVQDEVVNQVRFDATTRSVTLTVDPEDLERRSATICGRVVDTASGVPLQAQVAQWSDSGGLLSSAETVSGVGDFELVDAALGPSTISIYSEGRALFFEELTLTRGEQKHFGDVNLRPPARIEGVVRGPRGSNRTPGIQVGLLDQSGGRPRWLPRQLLPHLEIDPDGTFRIIAIDPNRRMALRATGSSRDRWALADLKSRTIEIRPNGPSTLDVTLEVRAATGVVTLAQRWDARPWPIANLIPLGSEADSVRCDIGRWKPETTVRLVPGDYELVVEFEDRVLDRRPLRVDAGPTRIELGLEQP